MGLLDQASSFATTLAEQQTGLNMSQAQQEAWLNRSNQQSPYGSVSYTQDPNTLQFTQNTQLSPEMQKQFDLQQGAGTGLLSQASANFANPLSYGGLPSLSGNGLADRDAMAENIYNSQVGQIDKAHDRSFDKLMQTKADSGIGFGNTANWKNSFQDFNDSWGDTYGDLRSNAYQQASQDQSNMFNQSLLGRQQGIAERESQYFNPLNAYNSLMGGGSTGPSAAASSLSGAQVPSVSLANTDVMGPASNFFSTLQGGENAAMSADASRYAAELNAQSSAAALDFSRSSSQSANDFAIWSYNQQNPDNPYIPGQ